MTSGHQIRQVIAASIASVSARRSSSGCDGATSPFPLPSDIEVAYSDREINATVMAIVRRVRV